MATSEARRAASTLISQFARNFPGEVARGIEQLPDAPNAHWLRSLSSRQIADVLERLTPDIGARVLVQMRDGLAGRVLTSIDPARAVSLMYWLDPPARERYLALVDPRTARELQALASYPDDSAGRLMDPRVVTLREDTTAREALARLRSRGQHADGEIYVVDSLGRLTGIVTSRMPG